MSGCNFYLGHEGYLHDNKYAKSKPRGARIKLYLMLITVKKKDNVLNLLERVFGIAPMVHYV